MIMDYRNRERRRAFLRSAFYASTAGAAAPLLSACGSPQTLDPPIDGGDGPVAGSGELDIPTGRMGEALKNTGYQAEDGNGLILPDGFTSTLLATSGLPVQTTGVSTPYTWHPLPDGGACFPKLDGGWVYTSNSAVPGVPHGGCGALSFTAHAAVVEASSTLTGATPN